jgi:tRNA1(Val) A37 N6-methylase TrmN6
MRNVMTSLQKDLYENPKKWGKEYHRIGLKRASFVVRAVPQNAKRILDLGSGDGLVLIR